MKGEKMDVEEEDDEGRDWREEAPVWESLYEQGGEHGYWVRGTQTMSSRCALEKIAEVEPEDVIWA